MRILLADDEPVLSQLLHFVLTGDGHEVHAVADGSVALEAFVGATFDLVITDMLMPGMDGLSLVREIKSRNPVQQIILLTGTDLHGPAPEDVQHILPKPVNIPRLKQLIAAVAAAR
jgi:CheY-like chemotaxis protein